MNFIAACRGQVGEHRRGGRQRRAKRRDGRGTRAAAEDFQARNAFRGAPRRLPRGGLRCAVGLIRGMQQWPWTVSGIGFGGSSRLR
ncbi:hypothetical protein [Xanthomonas graminis]|uniref:hypothetical protein n=1 Tax=Xanthomonas graminis TaxID=3390026 RepID=UPI001112DB8B|nr:hypothetical protein [Xanthomonas translucens]